MSRTPSQPECHVIAVKEKDESVGKTERKSTTPPAAPSPSIADPTDPVKVSVLRDHPP